MKCSRMRLGVSWFAHASMVRAFSLEDPFRLSMACAGAPLLLVQPNEGSLFTKLWKQSTKVRFFTFSLILMYDKCYSWIKSVLRFVSKHWNSDFTQCEPPIRTCQTYLTSVRCAPTPQIQCLCLSFTKTIALNWIELLEFVSRIIWRLVFFFTHQIFPQVRISVGGLSKVFWNQW